MTEENKRLFKLAIAEGFSNRIDKRIAECTEEIVITAAHRRAMRRIINGTMEKRGLTPRKKAIIAILVAVALLLTSCAVIYRKEIAQFIEEIYESFMTLETADAGDEETQIEDVYELTYVPEGYSLKERYEYKTLTRTVFANGEDAIAFEQQSQRVNYLDSENVHTKIAEAGNLDIYYRQSLEYHNYLWNNGD
ncbi:MAG: DUF4367 domain-containing protein, partial [Clostridia bacterium]|nr:DUF4367 domain-containing protein [Clostridia bacterium]